MQHVSKLQRSPRMNVRQEADRTYFDTELPKLNIGMQNVRIRLPGFVFRILFSRGSEIRSRTN